MRWPTPTAVSPEAADTYRRFADTAILLRALLQPGGIPPFPRLALNRTAGGRRRAFRRRSPSRSSPGGLLAGGTDRLRCVHKSHPRLLASDLSRIDEARAVSGRGGAVGLAEFHGAADGRTAGEPPTTLSRRTEVGIRPAGPIIRAASARRCRRHNRFVPALLSEPEARKSAWSDDVSSGSHLPQPAASRPLCRPAAGGQEGSRPLGGRSEPRQAATEPVRGCDH